jgi:Nitroreductase family.
MKLPEFDQSPLSTISKRYSCRAFSAPSQRSAAALEELMGFARGLGPGPLGGTPRFELIASEPGDASAIKGLGTYGMIRNPSAFLAVVQPAGVGALDLGWVTELVVLKATELGLGSCWLGGTFRRGRFTQAAKVGAGEEIGFVIPLGEPAPGSEAQLVRRMIGSKRKPWAEIFFDGSFERGIDAAGSLGDAGSSDAWAKVLEALRFAPSASNKQPWALLRSGTGWELYLRRNPGYYSERARDKGMPDMQLNDLGIAMAHFSLAARELGLGGAWELEDGAREPAAYLKGEAEARPVLVARFA